jgi:hypothetical protein
MSQFFAPFLPEFPFPRAESPMIDGSSPLDTTNNSSTDAGDSINAQVEHLLQYSNKDLTKVWYNNCLETDYETEKESFPPIREMIDGRAMFLEAKEYSPSRAVSAMPYIWQHHRKKKHHLSEFMMVVKVFSLECKVLDPREFTKIFGWTLKVRENGINLAYQKIQKALHETFPNPASRKLLSNFQAIIDKIYKVLDDEKLKQMVSGKVALQFLKQTSFGSKVRLATQEYQQSLIVLTAFLLPFIDANDEHSDDYEYWMWCVFKHCRTQPMFNVHLHNMYSVFPNDQGLTALAIQLLTMHKSHIRDNVASLASTPGHYLQYNNKLEARLLTYKGSSHNGKRAGKEQNMTMACSRSRDWALPQLPVTEEERGKLKSRMKRSRSSLSTNCSSPGGGELVPGALLVCLLLHSCLPEDCSFAHLSSR